MIVNLCREVKETNYLIERSFSKETILDITGIISSSTTTILRLANIDPDGELETIAIKKYIDFIGLLSECRIQKETIRDFTIFGRPVFWFTPLSEKHDSYHWGKDFWMLYAILLFKKEFFTGQTKVIIPNKYSHVLPLINEFFKKAGIGEPDVILAGDYIKKIGVSQFVRNNLGSFFKAILLIKSSKRFVGVNIKECKNIFIVKASNSVSISEDNDMGEIFKFSSSKIESIAIPFFDSYKGEFSRWGKLDNKFIEASPSIKQMVSLFIQQLKVYFKIIKYRNASLEVGDLTIPFSVVGVDLLEGCHHIHYFNFLWLRNYAQSIIGQTKFFYSDEYYISGRIISAALKSANNSNIKTYGIQHGLLLENHTVYKITQREIDDAHGGSLGLPIPDFFVVWGEYFKQIFLKSNQLSNDYVIVAGNLKYINLINNKTIYVKNNRAKRLLWCTSLPNHFKAEYNILEQALKVCDNYTLTFRLHPFGHIKKEDIIEWVDGEIIQHASFSNEPNIFEDILNHDIIISTIFSTTFFDALIMGKLSCRIITGIVKADFMNVEMENLYDIKTSAEFSRILSINSDSPIRNNNSINVKSFCHISKDVWTKVVSHA